LDIKSEKFKKVQILNHTHFCFF